MIARAGAGFRHAWLRGGCILWQMASFVSAGIPIRIDQQEPSAPGRHPAILLLHGSGGNSSFWLSRIAPQLARLNLGLYAVHYFDRTRTVRADLGTILDGHHFPAWQSTVGDAVAYIRTRPFVDPDRIALLGVSLGGFLALSHAVSAEAGIRAVVEISGGMPENAIPLMRPSYPPTLILHGDQDTVVPVRLAHQLKELLERLHVPHQAVILPGQGHWFDAPAQLQIMMATAGFLASHL